MNKSILSTTLFLQIFTINCSDNDQQVSQASSSLQALSISRVIAYKDLKEFSKEQQELVEALQTCNEDKIRSFANKQIDCNFKFKVTKPDQQSWDSPLLIALFKAALNDYTENNGTFEGLQLLQQKGCLTKAGLMENISEFQNFKGGNFFDWLHCFGARRLALNLRQMIYNRDSGSNKKLTIYSNKRSCNLRYSFSKCYMGPEDNEVVVFSEHSPQ